MPRPIDCPSSGRRFGPKMIRTMMRTTAISSGPTLGIERMLAAGDEDSELVLAGLARGEIEVEAAGRGLGLALVLAPGLAGPIGMLDRAVHPHEGDLADGHPVVDRDGQVGQVGELQRQVSLEARVDEAGGAV